MEESYARILKRAYEMFNDRQADEVLALMTDDVHWPNGWEGGYVNGKNEVKNYWTRQWQQLDPVVIPIEFIKLDDGRIEVKVHQVVRTLSGEIIFDGVVMHTYQFHNGLIAGMEIGN